MPDADQTDPSVPADPRLGRRAMLAALGALAGGAALARCAPAPAREAQVPSGATAPWAATPGAPGSSAAPGRSDAPATSATRGGTYARTISLAEWSVNRSVKAGTLKHVDFPVEARRSYGIGAVEYVSTLFPGASADDATLRQLNAACSGEGVRSVLIMIDAEGDLGAPTAAARADAIARHERWAHAAAALGCFAIRVNARSEGTPDEQRSRCAEGIGTLADRAAKTGMAVIVENHGGISSDGAWMASLMRAIARPNVGTLPDFGNFRLSPTQSYDRYQGIAEMLPWARDVSAKSYGFDALGDETTIDYARMFGLLDAARYTGFIGIEYEGKVLSEHDGILATKRLVERYGARA